MDPNFDILIFMLVLAGLFMTGSVPLILQKIPPNRWYGARTPSTLSDSRIWYTVNRFAGIAYFVVGLVLLLAALTMHFILGFVFNPWAMAFGSVAVFVVANAAAKLVVWLYGKRL